MVTGDVLHGNLLLRGYGDSDLDADALRRMLQRVRDRGIREIRGDLLLVRDWFSPPRPDLGVPPYLIGDHRSDNMLSVAMRAQGAVADVTRLPEKYRENSRMELTGANGGPVRTVLVDELGAASDEALRSLVTAATVVAEPKP